MKKPARKTRESDAALYASEERNAAWAELERKGWEVFEGCLTGDWIALQDGSALDYTRHATRDQAIDYALQLAHKQEK